MKALPALLSGLPSGSGFSLGGMGGGAGRRLVACLAPAWRQAVNAEIREERHATSRS